MTRNSTHRFDINSCLRVRLTPGPQLLYNYYVGFLAHLSRRLTGELIGYPWIRRPSSVVVRPFTFSNIFSSETAWPIKAKFYVEPPWEGGTKLCINGPGHMTKMAATPIYGKYLKKSSPQNRQADFHETWYVASGTPVHHSLYK